MDGIKDNENIKRKVPARPVPSPTKIPSFREITIMREKKRPTQISYYTCWVQVNVCWVCENSEIYGNSSGIVYWGQMLKIVHVQIIRPPLKTYDLSTERLALLPIGHIVVN